MSDFIPEFLREKLIDEHCPRHNKQLFLIDGKKKCPACQARRAEKQYQDKIRENMDGRLDDYNKQKLAKKYPVLIVQEDQK